MAAGPGLAGAWAGAAFGAWPAARWRSRRPCEGTSGAGQRRGGGGGRGGGPGGRPLIRNSSGMNSGVPARSARPTHRFLLGSPPRRGGRHGRACPGPPKPPSALPGRVGRGCGPGRWGWVGALGWEPGTPSCHQGCLARPGLAGPYCQQLQPPPHEAGRGTRPRARPGASGQASPPFRYPSTEGQREAASGLRGAKPRGHLNPDLPWLELSSTPCHPHTRGGEEIYPSHFGGLKWGCPEHPPRASGNRETSGHHPLRPGWRGGAGLGVGGSLRSTPQARSDLGGAFGHPLPASCALLPAFCSVLFPQSRGL